MDLMVIVIGFVASMMVFSLSVVIVFALVNMLMKLLGDVV